jgi:hypothetical protein
MVVTQTLYSYGDSMSREIMQQALDVIIELYNERDEVCERTKNLYVAADETIAALEQELAKPEQEPVAWITRQSGDGGRVLQGYETCEANDYGAIPVYTAPPRKEWVGLTDDVIWDIAADYFDADAQYDGVIAYSRAIEDKLKEKNK